MKALLASESVFRRVRTAWLILPFITLVAVGSACSSPTVPRLPTEEEEQDPNPDDEDIGHLDRNATLPIVV